MGMVPPNKDFDTYAEAEPTAGELLAIEAEWPVIAAELDVVDAEIHIVSASRPSALDWRRLCRAERRALTLRNLWTRPATAPTDLSGAA